MIAKARLRWFLALAFLLGTAFAADPLYSSRYTTTPLVVRKSATGGATELDETTFVRRRSQPWRQPQRYNSQRRRVYETRSTPVAANYLSYAEALKDPRSRFYSVNFDTRNIGRMSWTSRLVWMNLIVFALQAWNPSVTAWGIKLSDRIRAGQDLYRTVTPVFLHGNIAHLGTNMISLQRTGSDVEKLFGSGRFLATYLVSGIAGNVLSAYCSPNPALGASGAIFGIFGAYFVFLSRNDWMMGRYGAMMTNSITQTIGANVLLGFLNPSVDNWGHLGGLFGGAAAAYWWGPRLYLTEYPNTGRRVLIDRPLVRAPRAWEQLSGRVAKSFEGLSRQFPFAQSDKPWIRRSRPKQGLPTRSIKPLPVD